MFYLRRVEEDSKQESNSTLGKSYIFEHRDTCQDWERRKDKVLDWMSEDAKERTFGIIYDSLGNPTPLFKDLTYYVMTESGKTYAKLQ